MLSMLLGIVLEIMASSN